MTTQIVPFESAKAPAHIKSKGTVVNMFAAAKASGGFPIISIKGKVFHVVRGDERTLVTKPDADDEPAASLEVVILAANPHKSKVYYASGFEEGSTAKPDCYSNNGVTPEADAQTPQAKKCALCPHAAWGSKITESGKKSKACSDSMRLAVAPVGQLNDPMLLRVPPASLATLGEYGDYISKRNYEPQQVVTKVGFDYTVAHPALTFKVLGFVTAEMLVEIEKSVEMDVVKQIIGIAAEDVEALEPFEQAVPAEKPKAVKTPALEATIAAAKSVSKVKVEDDDTPAPVADKPKAKKAEPAIASIEEVEAALDDFDFDD